VAERRPAAQSASYLRNAQGQPVYSGPVNIAGRSYNLAPTAFPLTEDNATHYMHGLSVKSNTKGAFDWELAASLYDYSKDSTRSPTIALPLAAYGGAGTLQDQGGTGWNTLAAKGTWRPQGVGGAHIVDFGVGRDAYKLGIVKTNVLGNWQDGAAFTPVSNVGGRTETYSAWAQDAWSFAPKWKTVLGLRYENWKATDGFTSGATSSHLRFAQRVGRVAQGGAGLSAHEVHGDQGIGGPRGALSHGRRALRRHLGRCAVVHQRPHAQAREVMDGRALGRAGPGQRAAARHAVPRDDEQRAVQPAHPQLHGLARAEHRQGAHHRRGDRLHGAERVHQGPRPGRQPDLCGLEDGGRRRLSRGVGKWQPRVPRWRSTVYATYKPDARWSFTAAARYSGRQYSNLDNSDVNAFAYFGASKYFTVDLRVRYQIDKQWSAAFGIDNANNYQYWNFHPYPQRTYSAELRFDL
jgi:iron complex outermembrane receptor protein